jgi:hypothetical protein
MGDAVTVEYGDGVTEITINRPEGARAFTQKRAPRWKGR